MSGCGDNDFVRRMVRIARGAFFELISRRVIMVTKWPTDLWCDKVALQADRERRAAMPRIQFAVHSGTTVEALRTKATEVLDIAPGQKTFAPIEFGCYGQLVCLDGLDFVGDRPPLVVSSYECRNTYVSATVLCRSLGATDGSGREIFESKNGQLFVCCFQPGQRGPDQMRLMSPSF